jgi:hypothetical protein
MKSYRATVLGLSFILLLLSANASSDAPGKTSTGAPAAQPFASFKRIDSQLTMIDRNLQELASSINNADRLHRRNDRLRAVRDLRRSTALRSLRSSSASLVATSRLLEHHYKQPPQRYGTRIFGSLHREALGMTRSEGRIAHAKTVNEVRAAQRKFSANLLAFVLQFQAVSGGYGALECVPGQWACCQPSVRRLGTSSVRGCTWICTKSVHSCRSGCLGPRTPRTARVVANSARQNSRSR